MHGEGQVSSPPPDQPRPSPDPVLSPDSWRETGKRASAPTTGFRSRGHRAPGAPAAQNAPLIDQVPSFPHAEAPSFQSPYMMSQSSSSSPGLPEKTTSSGKPAAPAHHGKSGKRGLNLLNPMSLLLRRRSAQALQHLSEESLVTNRSKVVPAMTMGDDFDPSIRGNIVHDFSAPKPRRAVSYDPAADKLGVRESDTGRRSRQTDDESPSKRDRSHTPVFKENFDDDTEADDEKRKSAIRAETLANHDFLARNVVPESEPEPPAPPFARIPSKAPHLARKSIPVPLTYVPVRDDEAAGLATVPEASPTSPVSQGSKQSSTTRTPQKSRSRATSGADSVFQPAGLPTHMTSRASRFSFQIAGVDSAAQEKLLEEKHRQRVAEREQSSGRNGAQDYGDEEDDSFEYEDIDEGIFAGFEEEIPTIGADYDDNDYGYGGYNIGQPAGLSSFDFNTMNNRVPFSSTLSPISAGGESLVTPRDSHGNVIGSALTEDHKPVPSPLGAPPINDDHQTSPDAIGLGFVEAGDSFDEFGQTTLSPRSGPAQPQRQNILDDDDDLYFDDGMIGEPEIPENGQAFDESVFDDPNHPLYERPAPAQKSPPLANAEPESGNHGGYLDPEEDEEDEEFEGSGVVPHPSMRGHGRTFQAASDPFEFSNPQDYFSALVEATHQAEADGRFTRNPSVASTKETLPSKDEEDGRDEQNSNTVRNSQDTAPSLVLDSGRVSGANETFSSHAMDDFDDMGFDADAYGDDFGDGFDDYDSALEDDPIIAAANAEALANDYEGEYGSEFGFYAAANGGPDSVYGGYFGPRDALGRSISGRYAVREPNLTPITERSEYSTRNSFIGLAPWSAGPTSAGPTGPHGSANALPSPGIAQLARMSPYGFPPGSEDDYDYDYRLEQLMKLRKGAFGGAGTASPGGSPASSPRNSSPLSYFPGSFPRGSSPVATRAKSALDTYSDLPEVEETSNETTGLGEGDAPEEPQDEEALVSEINRADSASEYSAVSTYDENKQEEKETTADPAPPAEKKVPHQINTNYECFLPDQPGNIPISVPNSAISTTSTSSIPMSHTSAGGGGGYFTASSTAGGSIASPPLVSPPADNPHPYGFHANAAIHQHRDSAASISLLSPLSPPPPTSSSSTSTTNHNLADHPHRKSGGRHSRTSSAADSVAYVKERIETDDLDRPPEFRWVLERRRTSVTGEVEVVGREVVEGGRI